MKNFKNYFLLTIFSTILLTSIYGQEVVVGLNENSIIKTYIKANNQVIEKNKSTKTIVNLPFWDDFSDSQVFPKPSLWSDNCVFINTTYAPNPPTIGMATFDMLDGPGNIYEQASYNNSIQADTLTSQQINLNYLPSDNVYLSFYYRPQGFGDSPEIKDSLVLEFQSPGSAKWERVWAKEGSTDHEFKVVILKITEERFLKSGFRFRFKNYGSLGSSTYPSLAANCDQWHIDYVYLNKNRSAKDTIFKDVAFTSPLKSILKNYESMPWTHYITNPSKMMGSNFDVTYKNNDKKLRLIDSLNFYFKDNSGTTPIVKLEAGTYNLPPNNESTLNINNNYIFPANNKLTSTFEIKANLVTDSYDSIQNNTVLYQQNFFDYYAYDDGTAEAGYGLIGSGTKYGRVALKYFPEKADAIIGVDIYFNRSYKDASKKYFWLNIWKQAENGFPVDTAFFKIEGAQPIYETDLNRFHYYEFSEPVYVTDTFYVGWTQTSEDLLNVGIDFNRKANKNLLFNIGGGWRPSVIEGALMIRPVFAGNYTEPNKNETQTFDVKLFPAPAKSFLKISVPEEFLNQNIAISIYNINGIPIYVNNNFTDNEINLQSFNSGVYIIKIISQKGFFVTKKFTITK